MPITLVNARSVLITRLRGKLLFVGKSIVNLPLTPNPDLDMPIATAISVMGGKVADFAALSDDDLGGITSPHVLFGLSELFALRDIWGSYVDVTETDNGREQDWSLMSKEIADRLAQLEKLYGTFLTFLKPLQAGTIQLPFISRGGPEF